MKRLDKDSYLKHLRNYLGALPEEDVDAIIQDYEDYFAAELLNGYTVAETVKELGSPFKQAQNILKGHDLKPRFERAKDSPFSSETSQTLIVIALFVFNFVFILGPAVGIIGLLLGLTVMFFAFIFSPVVTISAYLFGSGALFELFISVTLAGIGLIAISACLGMLKGFLRLIKKYVAINRQLARGELFK